MQSVSEDRKKNQMINSKNIKWILAKDECWGAWRNRKHLCRRLGQACASACRGEIRKQRSTKLREVCTRLFYPTAFSLSQLPLSTVKLLYQDVLAYLPMPWCSLVALYFCSLSDIAQQVRIPWSCLVWVLSCIASMYPRRWALSRNWAILALRSTVLLQISASCCSFQSQKCWCEVRDFGSGDTAASLEDRATG